MLKMIETIVHRLRGEADINELKRHGLRIGRGCSIQPQVVIDRSHCWLVTIGNNVTIAPRAYILAHDASTKRALGYTRIGLVTIEDDAFIGAGAIILPGVRVGAGSIVGAGAVVTRDVEPGVVVAGSPACVIGEVADFLDRQRGAMKGLPVFDRTYTVSAGVGEEAKREMVRELGKFGGRGFVE